VGAAKGFHASPRFAKHVTAPCVSSQSICASR
jgi:hypothetical protein